MNRKEIDMRNYKVKVCIPSADNAWKASIEERFVTAENFNYLLMKAVTVNELKSGVRIVEIWEEQNDRYHSFMKVC